MSVEFDWLNDTNIPIGDSTETVYNNSGSGEKTVIHLITLHNTHSSAVSVTLYLVPDSSGSPGTAGTGNQVYKQDLDPDETIQWNTGGIWLADTGDTLQAVAGTANVVNIFAYGAVQS